MKKFGGMPLLCAVSLAFVLVGSLASSADTQKKGATQKVSSVMFADETAGDTDSLKPQTTTAESVIEWSFAVLIALASIFLVLWSLESTGWIDPAEAYLKKRRRFADAGNRQNRRYLDI